MSFLLVWRSVPIFTFFDLSNLCHKISCLFLPINVFKWKKIISKEVVPCEMISL